MKIDSKPLMDFLCSSESLARKEAELYRLNEAKRVIDNLRYEALRLQDRWR